MGGELSMVGSALPNGATACGAGVDEHLHWDRHPHELCRRRLWRANICRTRPRPFGSQVFTPPWPGCGIRGVFPAFWQIKIVDSNSQIVI